MQIWLILLLGMGTSLAATPRKPGLRTRITQKGLHYAADVAVDLLMKEIPKIRLPEIQEKIGPVSIHINNVRMRMARPSAAIVPRPQIGLRWTLSNLSPVLTADYHASMKIAFWTVHKHGKVTIRGNGLIFLLDILVGRSNVGRPTISAQSCRPMSGSVSVSFRGGWDNILNFGAKVVKGKLKSLITAQICSKARQEIDNQAAWALGRVSMEETIEKYYKLDFGLVRWPVFATGYSELLHKGLIVYTRNRKQPPFQAPDIPAYPEHTARMVYIYVTDYLINSGFYAAHSNGMLRLNITSSMLPAETRGYLNTTCPMAICMGMVFPQLTEKHPNLQVEFDVVTTTAPSVSIRGKLMDLHATLDAEAYVRDATSRHHIFTINATIDATLNISISGVKITFSITDIKPKANVKDSKIGNVGSTFFYDFLIRLATQQFLKPKMQELGKKGFPVPDLKDVEFVKPEVISGTTDVFIIGTDVKYTVA